MEQKNGSWMGDSNPITEKSGTFASGDYHLLQKGKDLLNVEFNRIRPDGSSALLDIQKHKEKKIAIVGQADPRPIFTKDYTNLGLSSLRAASVGDYLIRDLGVDSTQIVVIGLGEQWLPDQKTDENIDDYYARCRRILIMYMENTEQQLLNKVRQIE